MMTSYEDNDDDDYDIFGSRGFGYLRRNGDKRQIKKILWRVLTRTVRLNRA
jgi:hypothetical protein